MKIHLKLNGKVFAATLARSRTARELAAMLPLTITLHDLFRREKFGPLPRPISGKGTRTRAYEVGDLVCWGPGPDLSIFYRHDGQTISGGIHVIGKLDAGAEAFDVPGPLNVTLEWPASDIARPAVAMRPPRPVPSALLPSRESMPPV
ncbi:cyclophilin-like fold protein [Variovorax sp. PBL-E5]|uniref:cyclophilin-like fold protein n=1 Tax=Variovorax sp. PBL-E5 TaxID=434014 RepID=UPI001315DD01|nr:cyclophilin-like fold protein [Variovorax sp. PBL-E5]VTU45815.1 hypothetical protein E5P2_00359 [Variovorax sp. PBL-E5]